MTAQGGVRQDFLHVQAYTIMHTLTYTSDFNFVTPCCILINFLNQIFNPIQWINYCQINAYVFLKALLLVIFG